MKASELKIFLDEKADFYNHISFIEKDPIQIPHRFSIKQDIEIAAFLTATISWGNRKSIINDAEKMMNWMDNSPFDFVLNFKNTDLNFIENKAVHRTFNAVDFLFFLQALKRIYKTHPTLENLFLLQNKETSFYHAIERFRKDFFTEQPKHRSTKHISSPYKNSAAKRLMMFLRWMVRQDQKGVDFGLWKNLNPKHLSIPLDVHTAKTARSLGLIKSTQNNWKTIEELDVTLRKMDAKDPAKYDFALFGLSVDKEI